MKLVNVLVRVVGLVILAVWAAGAFMAGMCELGNVCDSLICATVPLMLLVLLSGEMFFYLHTRRFVCCKEPQASKSE